MTIRLGGTKKQIRISRTERSRLAIAGHTQPQTRSREVRTECSGSSRAADWQPDIIRFESSPFQSGPQDIKVPPGRPLTVSQPPGSTSIQVYEVVNGKEKLKGRPDVIID